jgi:hypothetical protein
MVELITINRIESRILQLRGKKVLLDEDLSFLYGVDTKYLKRQVRRNKERFPDDFLFTLTKKEYKDFLRSQFGTLEQGKYSKYLPYAFTEQGVAMLSSVLNSKQAIMVNIQIMRAFINSRRTGLTYASMKRKIENMENKYDSQFSMVFKAIKKLLEPPIEDNKRKIGFRPE